MPEKLTPKAQADQLLEHLLRGKQVHEIFSDSMRRQLPISGQSMDHWEKRFRITIPTGGLTPAICKDLSMQILDLNQEATFLHAVAGAKSQLIKHGSESTFLGRFQAIVGQYTVEGKKLPGQETLQRLASIDGQDVDAAMAIADIEVNYWKDILDHLSTCRKLVENASLNISVELKALQADVAMDRLVAKIGNGNGGSHDR